MVIAAVKVSDSPEQIAPLGFAVMLTVGVTCEFIITVELPSIPQQVPLKVLK